MWLKFNYSSQGISLSNQHIVQYQEHPATPLIWLLFLDLYVMAEVMNHLRDQLASRLDEGGIDVFIRLVRLLNRTRP